MPTLQSRTTKVGGLCVHTHAKPPPLLPIPGRAPSAKVGLWFYSSVYCACSFHKPSLGRCTKGRAEPYRKVPQPPSSPHRRLGQPAAASPPGSSPPGPLPGSCRTSGLGAASPEQHSHGDCECVSLPARWLPGILLARGSALAHRSQHWSPAGHCHLYGHPAR